MFATLFNEVLYRPIFNVLVTLYELTGDLGIAIILITILIKLVLYPLSKKQIESQKKIQKIQPKINELKEKYKDDKETQSKELMKLYKDEKINPAAGCLPLLIQLPVLIALYRALMPGNVLVIDGEHLRVVQEMLYSFLPWLQNVGEINKMFLGIIDLTQKSIPLAFISSILQYIQSKTMYGSQKKKEKKKDSKEPNFQDALSSQMTFIMPLVTFFFGMSFPAGLPLYWAASTAVMIVQQWFTNKSVDRRS